MPQLFVRCPRCDADLTVGRELLNRPVECGACGRAFVAVMDPGGREPDDLPARPKRGQGSALLGILSLITGGMGMMCCWAGPAGTIMSGCALVIGLIGLIGRDSRSLSILGLVLAVVGFVLQAFAALRGMSSW